MDDLAKSFDHPELDVYEDCQREINAYREALKKCVTGIHGLVAELDRIKHDLILPREWDQPPFRLSREELTQLGVVAEAQAHQATAAARAVL